MKLLRRLFGLDFPDPEAGQVWRSRHSGSVFRVTRVRRSDCGEMWHITLQFSDDQGFIPIGQAYCMYPSQWRRMLRDEGRVLGTGAIEPSRPWPRPLTEQGVKHEDTVLLDFIASEYLDVLAFSMPTGQGDADVGWKLLQHHMGKKGVVEVACHYRDDLRAAIREAMLQLDYMPPADGASGDQTFSQETPT